MGKMMKIPRLVLAAIIAGLPVLAAADEWQLWNDCNPVFHLVEGLGPGAKKTGLTRERIQIAVESRLRGARIFPDPEATRSAVNAGEENPYGVYYVNVNAVDRAFHVSVEFILSTGRLVKGESQTGLSTTWDKGTVGLSGDDGYILQSHLHCARLSPGMEEV